MQHLKDILIKMNAYGKASIPFFFIIDFDLRKPEVYEIGELKQNSIYPQIGNLNRCPENPKTKGAIDFRKIPMAFSHYKVAFNRVMESIEMGDSFLLNLTFSTNIQTNLELKDIFVHSKAKYKLLYKDQFVVFSPEPFIRICSNTISSYPMKGTINADIPNAEQRLLDNDKEKSEHNTIVDLIRNDLSIVAEKVRVKRFRYVEEVKTHEKKLLQTSSEISGQLPKNWKSKLGDIIFRLLPAGSISGAPKMKTCEIIRDAENYERGYFTGIFGYFDGNNLDSAVMIRFIEKQGENLVFKSGGGITSMSKAKEEYEEMLAKVYLPIVE